MKGIVRLWQGAAMRQLSWLKTIWGYRKMSSIPNPFDYRFAVDMPSAKQYDLDALTNRVNRLEKELNELKRGVERVSDD